MHDAGRAEEYIQADPGEAVLRAQRKVACKRKKKNRFFIVFLGQLVNVPWPTYDCIKWLQYFLPMCTHDLRLAWSAANNAMFSSHFYLILPAFFFLFFLAIFSREPQFIRELPNDIAKRGELMQHISGQLAHI